MTNEPLWHDVVSALFYPLVLLALVVLCNLPRKARGGGRPSVPAQEAAPARADRSGRAAGGRPQPGRTRRNLPPRGKAPPPHGAGGRRPRPR